MIYSVRLVFALIAFCPFALPLAAQAQQAPANNPARPAAAAQSAASSQAVPQQPVAERAAEIEERLIDLQVRIATLRSLSSTVAPAATATAPQLAYQEAPPPGAHQIAALEGEIRGLSADSSRLSGRPELILPESTRARRPLPDRRAPSGIARPTSPSPTASPTPDAVAAAPGWADSTTVSPRGQPQSNPDGNQGLFATPGQAPGTATQGELLPGTVYPGTGQPPPGAPAPQGDAIARLAQPVPPAGVPLAPVTDDPETEYQTAYGYLLQQDYGAALTAFREFIARYPNTPLTGNAQYWIGETHYVRGAYKKAAVAFLKGYEKYGDGNKGPDSLLKLALSLGKLSQTSAACSSLNELHARFPNAPQGVLARATAEKRRLRCTG